MDAGLRHRVQRGFLTIRVHCRDDRCATLHAAKLGSFRSAHFQDEIGIAQCGGRIGGNGCACCFVFRIRNAGCGARASLHGDESAEADKFLHRLRGGCHPRFGV